MKLQLLSHYPERDVRSRYVLGRGDAWFQETAALMHALLDALDAHPVRLTLWAYTSHTTLGLVDQDFAGIGIGMDAHDGEYRISYPLPPTQALWRGARGVGRTGLVDEAAAMILLAVGDVFPHLMGEDWPPLRQQLMAMPWRGAFW